MEESDPKFRCPVLVTHQAVAGKVRGFLIKEALKSML